MVLIGYTDNMILAGLGVSAIIVIGIILLVLMILLPIVIPVVVGAFLVALFVKLVFVFLHWFGII